jgi:hypothetical protein
MNPFPVAETGPHQCVQLTANSVRSCLASISSSG